MLQVSKFRAAILIGQKQPLEIAELTMPRELTAGQVLVRVKYSGICGSQLGEIDGVKGPDKFLPHLLGHEGSGEVLQVGPGVRRLKPGDKVVLHWRKSPGIEAEPPVYDWSGRKANAGWVTTFNDHAIVSENRLTVLPQDADMEVAALFGCAVTTGFGVVTNNARVKIGESVVVYGAGGIGLNIVQAAALAGAFPIVAVDIHSNRLTLAREMGATHAINATECDAFSALREALNGIPLDVFIDNTGKPAVIEAGYQLTREQGRIILVGVPQAGSKAAIATLPLHFGKQLTGSHGGEAIPNEDIPRYHNLYKAGRIRLKELLTHRCSLADINDAIAAMRSGAVSGRVLVDLSM